MLIGGCLTLSLEYFWLPSYAPQLRGVALDVDMEATGFEEDEINQIFAAAIDVDIADAAFDVEEEL